MSETEIQLAQGPQSRLQSRSAMNISCLDELMQVSQTIVKSKLTPKGIDTPEKVAIAIQCGLEIGLQPMQALQNIAVINGLPTIYGDSALALVRQSGLLELYNEETVGEGEDKGVKVTVKRQGFSAASEPFTVSDAKKAGLWGKSGPWSQHPRRMLKFRARGFLLRDQFGDVLKGLRTSQEVEDMPDGGDFIEIGETEDEFLDGLTREEPSEKGSGTTIARRAASTKQESAQ